MIERLLTYTIVVVVLIGLLAAYLPRVTPSLVALALAACVLRAVWFYTR